MRILITGAGGFIGRKLIQDMAGRPGIDIYALSRGSLNIPNVTHLKCDVLDGEAVERIFQKYTFDRVVHLAAITEHREIVDNKWKTFETNLMGTVNILKSFTRYCRGSQFLYSSTGKVYGKTNEIPITENALVNPLNILGKTKRITEEVIDLYSEPQNSYLVCRIFNIYGEGQKRNFVVPTILDQLNQGRVRLGSLNDLRDYLYIDDLSNALQACIADPGRFASMDYVNVGSGKPACVADILREMEKLLGREIPVDIELSRLRQDETAVEYCSHDKLTALTGWEPKYSLEEGLKKTMRKEGVI